MYKISEQNRIKRMNSFIERFEKINSNLLVDSSGYQNNRIKLPTTCKLCNRSGLVTPSNLLNGIECAACKGVTQSNTTEFINKSRLRFGNKFDYSCVNYISSKIHVNIICNKCKYTWLQTPSNHLSGKGCPNCAQNLPLSLNANIERAIATHGLAFDYSSARVENLRFVDIKCNTCNHMFSQGLKAHIIIACGCPRCSKREPYTRDRFIERSKEIHGDMTFGYDDVPEYFTSKKHIPLLCLKCYRVNCVIPTSHLIKKPGCPFCTQRVSKEETKWLDYLGIPQNNRQIRIPGSRRFADGFINNIVYEFNGSFWHGDPRKFESTALNKKCGITFGKLYQTTLDKEDEIRRLGFELFCVWQIDYRNGVMRSCERPHEKLARIFSI